MKLNKKGFVSSAVLYSLLLIFLALILGLLALLSNRKQILDKLKRDIKNDITKISVYDVYENGTVIYYNPVTGKICGDYSEENSATGVKSGCLKWYIFNDNNKKATVSMILDHNTTPLVAWNSEGTNAEMKEVQDELDNLKTESKWQVTPRLISADEVAEITGNDTFNSKLTDYNGSFYFETNTATQPSSYTGTYAWLYDNTFECASYGCNISDDNQYEYGTAETTNYMYGYWTSSLRVDDSSFAWIVHRHGRLGYDTINGSLGIRPVITILKKDINIDSFETIYNYTGKAQTFTTPLSGNYKIELWGAAGGDTTTLSSKGGYTLGEITLEKNKQLYIYVGENNQTTANTTSFNGGTGSSGGLSGGGATDLRLINSSWNDFDSLKSRIMVAAGGGVAYSNTGYGGGLVGGTASVDSSTGGTGGSQTTYGLAGNHTCATNGSFGIGGTCGGGGGGYYGGGGSSYALGGGGGGSSFISGHQGCNAITETSTSTSIVHTGQSVHYSGLKFTNTNMKAGNETMPTHDGTSTMTGNSGNGYAKITYLGNE